MNKVINVWNVGRIAFFAACMFAGYASGAHAEETKTVSRTVTVYMLSDNPELEKKVMAICGDTAIKLSPKARKACDDKAFPPLSKSKEFRNSGIGAEFNTLARNRS